VENATTLVHTMRTAVMDDARARFGSPWHAQLSESRFNESPPGALMARFFDKLTGLATPHPACRRTSRTSSGLLRVGAVNNDVLMSGHLFISKDAMLWLVTWVKEKFLHLPPRPPVGPEDCHSGLAIV
jgi:hypothetical protein